MYDIRNFLYYFIWSPISVIKLRCFYLRFYQNHFPLLKKIPFLCISYPFLFFKFCACKQPGISSLISLNFSSSIKISGSTSVLVKLLSKMDLGWYPCNKKKGEYFVVSFTAELYAKSTYFIYWLQRLGFSCTKWLSISTSVPLNFFVCPWLCGRYATELVFLISNDCNKSLTIFAVKCNPLFEWISSIAPNCEITSKR